MVSRKLVGLLGVISWSVVVLLRSMGLNGFIMGVMPNLGAALVCSYLLDVVVFKGKSLRVSLYAASAVFSLALLSEVVHDLFLNSPFDMNDIYTTILASVFYILVSKYELKKV